MIIDASFLTDYIRLRMYGYYPLRGVPLTYSSCSVYKADRLEPNPSPPSSSSSPTLTYSDYGSYPQP